MVLPSIAEIITTGMKMGASDIHLTVFRPPIFRINGRLLPQPDVEPLTAEDIQRLGQELAPDTTVLTRLKENGQDDFSNSFPGVGRVRVNLYVQRGVCAAAIRLIPVNVPQLENLGLPPVVHDLAMKEKGLLLVTGVTGSGKSTTLAGIINLLNHTRNYNILTLEDPIEYIHQHGTCVVNQREVGNDTISFAQGLRAALRQDPDVIMVGEMRDLETISTVITAAETGHLVLASLHSGSAAQTVERVIDAFPPHQQGQIRNQLATTLLGIITQELIPRNDGLGRVVATEILVASLAVRNLIRENKIHQIYSAIQTGSAAGMVTMEKSLKALYQQNIISCLEYSQRVASNEDQT
ncbi:MAG: type IV pilus twitching motility protein PilT [Syntrophomonas sp.]